MFIRSILLTGVFAAIVAACAAPTEAPSTDTIGSTAEAVTSCSTAYSCVGHTSGYPDVVVTCASAVNFFTHVNGGGPTYVETGTTYTTPANAVAHEIDACDLKDGTCAYFSNYEGSATYCGTVTSNPKPIAGPLCNGERQLGTCKAKGGWKCCGTDGWMCGVCQ